MVAATELMRDIVLQLVVHGADQTLQNNVILAPRWLQTKNQLNKYYFVVVCYFNWMTRIWISMVGQPITAVPLFGQMWRPW